MQQTWLVLLPPLLVIILAAVTHRILPALLAGIFCAVMVVHNFSPMAAFTAMIMRMWKITELGNLGSWETFWSSWYLFTCLFLLLLGMLIELIRASGGTQAYGFFVKKYLGSGRIAELACMGLSLLLCFDDYFSCLTVSSVMRGITDRFFIPRAKLAFLSVTLAGPLVVLFPITQWVAEIMMQLRQAGVAAVPAAGVTVLGDPFSTYLRIVPFLFYPIIAVASLLFFVMWRISYGSLRRQEEVAVQTTNLFGGKQATAHRRSTIDDSENKGSMIDFLLPIVTLITAVIGGILFFGDYSFFGGSNSFIQAIQMANAAAGLFVGALSTLVASAIFFLIRKRMTIIQMMDALRNGVSLIGPAVGTLILVWTLGSLLKNDLATGTYLAQVLVGSVKVSLLPVFFFVLAAVMSTMMGTALGTIALLFPIAIPLLVNLLQVTQPIDGFLIPVLFPMLGGIISGAVVGNHCSPISDVILMASTTSGAYHLDVYRIQLSFAFPTIFSTAIAFLVSGVILDGSGFVASSLNGLFVGIIVNISLLLILNRKSKKQLR